MKPMESTRIKTCKFIVQDSVRPVCLHSYNSLLKIQRPTQAILKGNTSTRLIGDGQNSESGHPFKRPYSKGTDPVLEGRRHSRCHFK